MTDDASTESTSPLAAARSGHVSLPWTVALGAVLGLGGWGGGALTSSSGVADRLSAIEGKLDVLASKLDDRDRRLASCEALGKEIEEWRRAVESRLAVLEKGS